MPTHRYRIVVAGRLGGIAREAFEGFEIESDGARTSLTADLDEAALFGALNRIQSLRLELLRLARLPSDESGPEPGRP